MRQFDVTDEAGIVASPLAAWFLAGKQSRSNAVLAGLGRLQDFLI